MTLHITGMVWARPASEFRAGWAWMDGYIPDCARL